MRVLIFPAGSESALDMYDSLRYRDDVEVFGLTTNDDFSSYRFDPAHFRCVDYRICDQDFDERFDALLREWGIDAVIPTHDAIVEYLAAKRDSYSARILVSDERTARICRSKRLMYQEFANEDYCPIIYDSANLVSADDYPVFCKLDISAASVGAFLARDSVELERAADDPDYVISEYLPGDELTIDCFTNRTGELAFAGARRTDRMRMGLPFRSTTVSMTDKLWGIVRSINAHLGFLGSWFVDLKQDALGHYKLMEVNCRQAGTLTLYRHLGINFTYQALRELMGKDASLELNPFGGQVERCVHNAFHLDFTYDAACIDASALLVKGAVCLPTICFAYQCANDGMPLTLIAIAAEQAALREHGVCLDIFERIISEIDGAPSAPTVFVSADDAVLDQAFDAGYLIFEPSTIDALIRE